MPTTRRSCQWCLIQLGTATPLSLSVEMLTRKIFRAGASLVRRQAVADVLMGGPIDVIKGNESEINSVFGDEKQQRGVDSSNALSIKERAVVAQILALRKNAVIVMTGETDIVSNGVVTVRIDNGHHYLSKITGSGCALGTAISAAVAVWPLKHKMAATVAAMLHYEIAAEIAAEAEHVRGPGTFMATFLDSLSEITEKNAEGDRSWLQRAKVDLVELD